LSSDEHDLHVAFTAAVCLKDMCVTHLI